MLAQDKPRQARQPARRSLAPALNAAQRRERSANLAEYRSLLNAPRTLHPREPQRDPRAARRAESFRQRANELREETERPKVDELAELRERTTAALEFSAPDLQPELELFVPPRTLCGQRVT